MTSQKGFQLLSSSPLAFIWPGFASHDECSALVSAGEVLRSAVEDSEGLGNELGENLRLFGISHGPAVTDKLADDVFKKVYCLPGSRKMRADFSVPPEDTEDFGDFRGLSKGRLPASGSALLKRFDATVSDFLGQPSHEDEDSCVLNCTPGRESTDHALECGLHVDTHNDEPRRTATAILYLNTVKGSGETVFPCAGDVDSTGRRLGESLLSDDAAESTQDLTLKDAALENRATALLQQQREGSSRRFREEDARIFSGVVKPVSGTLVLFFVRGEDGEVDPAAWHGSASVFPEHQTKWTLQTFKALSLSLFKDLENLSLVNAETIAPLAADVYNEHSFRPRRSWAPCLLQGGFFLRPSQLLNSVDPCKLYEERRSIGASPVRLEWFGADFFPLQSSSSSCSSAAAAALKGKKIPLYSAEILLGPLFGRLKNSVSEQTGLALWPGGLLLASYLARYGLNVCVENVLELGCGCGLPALTAAALGAKSVTLSDVADAALGLAKLNCETFLSRYSSGKEDLKLKVECLDFRINDDVEKRGELFDLVLVADLLYDRTFSDEEKPLPQDADLLKAIEKLIRRKGRALIAHQRRRSRDEKMATTLQNTCKDIGVNLEIREINLGGTCPRALTLLEATRK